jgi:hypothetical protein
MKNYSSEWKNVTPPTHVEVMFTNSITTKSPYLRKHANFKLDLIILG